jgi:hypothetical protein
MRITRGAVAGLAALAATATGGAALAQAGLLTGGSEKLEPPITLSAGQPLAAEPYELEAGGYYELTIEADGSQELALGGAEFFRNVWVNEVVIDVIEVRPMGGLDSLEFDAAGVATISFVVIRPGTFTLRIPGTTGETQQAIFNVTDPNGFVATNAPGSDDGDDDMEDAEGGGQEGGGGEGGAEGEGD